MQNTIEFGRASTLATTSSTAAPSALQRQHLRRALSHRLDEKMRNYERAAARLEVRGEDDAAKVLILAAAKLRTLTDRA